MRLSNVISSSAGLRSRDNLTFCFLFIYDDIVNAIGPDNPLFVNSISPNSLAISLPFSSIAQRLTFFRDIPCSAETFCFTIIGTSACRGSTIFNPNALAKA